MAIPAPVCAALLLLCCVSVSAHVRLVEASPADGSVLLASPTAIVLKFSQTVYLSSLWIRRNNTQRRALKPLPRTRAQRISMPVPPLTPGSYEVTWRALGEDGHIAFGSIHFRLSSAPASRAARNPRTDPLAGSYQN